jgi:DNA-binding transcriptional ArsR family regulator
MVNNQKKITAIFSALADPTRRGILVRLSDAGEGPVRSLAKPFHISPPAISRHLRVLEKARLIDRRRQGRLQVIRARAEGLKPAQDWMSHFAAGWDFSFNRLDELLGKEKKNEVRHKDQR